MSKSKNGKPLRIAALIRVSTEKQEQQGESLNTQTKQITAAVKQLGGKIVEWYGGQEHATPGHEKKEVDRLLRDSGKSRFDAVMIAYIDRWSRDNKKSEEGIDTFCKNRTRFFVLTSEYDLFDPQQRYIITNFTAMGQFFAHMQAKKSIQSRIERAKKGFPTGGKLPFGRHFDKKSGKWSIDKEKQKMVKDIAKRYLAGESMGQLASEYGINHPNLHKIMTQRCGTVWTMSFSFPRFAIEEQVPFTIPELLPKATINAILKRAKANKTYSHGHIKYRYLLSRMIFCAHCGYAMFGQTNHNGKQYYRHYKRQQTRPCPVEVHKWIPIEIIEENVVRKILDEFGNPKGVVKAIEAATPNRAKVKELRTQQENLSQQILKVETGIDRVVGLIATGRLADSEVDKQMNKLRQQKDKLVEQSNRVEAELEGTPDLAAIKKASQVISAKMLVLKENAEDYDKLKWEDKRALLENFFSGTLPDGRRMGVYVTWVGDDRWKFAIQGHVSTNPLRPLKSSTFTEVTNSASH